ncbi:MAG: ATP phosphoribosyltransferase regulatory subunit [Porticoccus sp.]|nr:ATP phosphoribosyltransferase regulatory subunit [Porticoccus sp.]MBQ0806916.1 ATP phosphoribosyltransferase regulatory subunit [Porticoccus sp.]
MTVADRWLLPDGVEEILPNQAFKVERLRRQVLDLYHGWGYDLVIPPLVEFTDSLLSGTGSDLDLMTFKVTDQISGRMMGIRADITPQTSRMDAHSLRRNGPSRLCYAGTVLYTKPRYPLASRSPIQIGVELYGEAGLAADIEVISLMVETLRLAGLEKPQLDLGHVGVYGNLLEEAGLSKNQEATLFDLLQRKSVPELDVWVADNISDTATATMIRALVDLAGDASVIDRARELFAEAPAEVELALDELQAVVDALKISSPDAELYLDLSELRGYHYHTGVVFAAYAPGAGQAIGNGGRYDHVGEAFGRSRPATGFNISLQALVQLSNNMDHIPSGIFVPAVESENSAQQKVIAELRKSGERVVSGFPGQQPNYEELHCDRQLLLVGGEFQIKAV